MHFCNLFPLGLSYLHMEHIKKIHHTKQIKIKISWMVNSDFYHFAQFLIELVKEDSKLR